MGNKYSRIMSVGLSVIMVITSVITYKSDIVAQEVTTETLTDVSNEETMTGPSGETDACYWEFNPDTETLSFYGYHTGFYDCEEIADKVKHVVFTENSMDVEFELGKTGSALHNLEDITLSAKAFIYGKDMFKESTKIKSYYVDEECYWFKTINGDLYDRDNVLYRHAVGKGLETVYINNQTTYVCDSAFYGNTKTTKVVVPESVEKIELPFYDGEFIKEIVILNPDCKIEFKPKDTANENMVIYSYGESFVSEQCMGYEFNFKEIDTEDIEGIEIETLPDNMSVIRGLEYKPNGLGLKISYKDGANVTVYEGYELSADTSKIGLTTVKLTYAGFSETFEINVIDIPTDQELKLNEIRNVTLKKGEDATYYFEPTVSGTYRIYTEGEYDTTVSILDNELVLTTDKNSGALLNGQVDIELQGGKVYNVNVKHSESDSVTFNIRTDLITDRESDGITITGTPVKDTIEPGERLQIKYNVLGLSDGQKVYYSEDPVRLEKSDKGVWKEMDLNIDISETVYSLTDGETVYVDLEKYYGLLPTGEYRYTQLIGYREISIKFNVFDIYALDRSQILSKDETVIVTMTRRGDKKTYYFRATNNEMCKFYTKGDYDTYATLECISDGTTVITNDDSGSGNNFYIAERLKEGYMYRLTIGTYSYEEHQFELVTKITCNHLYVMTETEASCANSGATVYTCKYCADRYEQEIEQLLHEHNYSEVAPTCTEDGYTIITCKNCDYYEEEVDEKALGHDYDEAIIPAKDGRKAYVVHICSRCDDFFKTDYVEESTDKVSTGEVSTKEESTIGENESSTTEIKVKKTKIKRLTSSKKKITIRLKKIRSITGYQIKISRKKDFSKFIKKNKKSTKITVKKLQSNKKYYVKVRCYIKKGENKTYSEWSKVRNITTK